MTWKCQFENAGKASEGAGKSRAGSCKAIENAGWRQVRCGEGQVRQLSYNWYISIR